MGISRTVALRVAVLFSCGAVNGRKSGSQEQRWITHLMAILQLDEGWPLVSVIGSHRMFRKGTVTVIVPHPKKNLPLSTARSIIKMAART